MKEVQPLRSLEMQPPLNAQRQYGGGAADEQLRGYADKDNVVESAVDAYEVTANAGASDSEFAECRGMVSGAPSHQGGGSAQHPDAIPFTAALWACVGDPNDALAMGGG